ncbi:MAG: ubiquinone/menaquinone biosynthesis methyltransferase [candidate division Zixibacteria bacterium]|nr:ubiquinone/menaquinone biosynthesis methyltransferase [candidate division Zixibacteria bacterium]
MRKKSFVKKMFTEIAGEYDRLNRIISWNLDLKWRKKAVKNLRKHNFVLDICSGTGDMAMILSRRNPVPRIIVLADLSLRMLKLAKDKLGEKSNQTQFLFVVADGENLPFKDNTYDAVIQGFALRNIENMSAFLGELNRISISPSEMVFLEIAHPENPIVGKLFYLYFYKFVPFYTKFLTGKDYAYRYLPISLRVFHKQKDFVKILNNAGFEDVWYQNILTGIAAIYYIHKS